MNFSGAAATVFHKSALCAMLPSYYMAQARLAIVTKIVLPHQLPFLLHKSTATDRVSAVSKTARCCYRMFHAAEPIITEVFRLFYFLAFFRFSIAALRLIQSDVAGVYPIKPFLSMNNMILNSWNKS